MDRDDLRLMSMVYGPGGTDRLSLFDILVENTGYYFHGLVWEQRVNDAWVVHHQISSEDFEWNHPFRRFVSELHSFAPEQGCAVIQVGEGDKPKLSFQSTRFHYSWRLWHLLDNREVKRLKDCASPFDPYDPTNA